MLAGAKGALNKVLLSFMALIGPNPQPELYFNLIESPTPAAAFEENFSTIILLVKVPESNEAVAPTVPIGMLHCHPEAAPDVVVAAGSIGAM
jgi:hypothetical protein